MKKSDLKTGMKVELRDGNSYIVFVDSSNNSGSEVNCLVSTTKSSWHSLDSFAENLLYRFDIWGDVQWDIMKVFQAEHPSSFTGVSDKWRLLWSREELPPEQKETEALKIIIEEANTKIKELTQVLSGDKP